MIALPVSMGLSAIGTPAFLWLAAVGLVAPLLYLLTLRLGFPESSRTVSA